MRDTYLAYRAPPDVPVGESSHPLPYILIPNAINTALKRTKGGNDVLADALLVGFEHGRSGKTLGHSTERFARLGMGPESLSEYHLGKLLGQTSAGKFSPSIREGMTKKKYKALQRAARVISKGAKNVEERHIDQVMKSLPSDLRNDANVRTILLAAKKSKSGKTGLLYKLFKKWEAEEGSKPSKLQNLVHGSLLIGAGTLNPHVFIQPALSKGREVLSKSKFGKEFAIREFKKGLAGKDPGKAVSLASDLLLSPGVLEARRAGLTTRRIAGHAGRSAKGFFSRIRQSVRSRQKK